MVFQVILLTAFLISKDIIRELPRLFFLDSIVFINSGIFKNLMFGLFRFRRCVPQKPCCQESGKQIWEAWYIWFGVALIFLLLITSIATYLASLCKKKQQNLIRIRNLSQNSREPTIISTINGPGGIIQPDIRHFSNQVGAESISTTTIAIAETSETDKKVDNFAKPLSPPYPPVEPVTIIRGSAPPQGFRQTESYTEIVLPPGYIDSSHYKP